MKRVNGWAYLIMICIISTVVAPPLTQASTVVVTDLVINGSFEAGEYTGNGTDLGWTRLEPGNNKLSGWTIGGDGVDWHNAEQMNSPSDGAKLVDLDTDGGGTKGSISQSLMTTPGTWYTLTFDMAGPDFYGGGYPVNLKITLGSVNGQSETHKEFSVTTSNNGSLSWETKIWAFKADSNATTLTIASLEGDSFWGPAVDNISVVEGGGPDIFTVQPLVAENSGIKRLTIYGRDFKDGAGIELNLDGELPVRGENIAILNGGYTMEADFDLTDAAQGLWDVKVTNSDGSSAEGSKLLNIFHGFVLSNFYPRSGINIGSRTIYISGENFTPGINVVLSNDGQPPILPDRIDIISPNTAEVHFSLNGKPIGDWTLSVSKNEDTSTASETFTINPFTEPARVNVSVNGPSQVRRNREATYFICFSNQGEIDATGVPIVHIPENATYKILSQPESLIQIPADRPERGKPFEFLNDLDPDNQTRVLLFPITKVPVDSPVVIRLSVLVPEDTGSYSIEASWDQFKP